MTVTEATESAVVPLAELHSDPYAVYARLRRHHPICLIPELNQWLVTRWSDVEAVVAQPEVFTSDQPLSGFTMLCGAKTMITRDGADHLDLRRAVEHDFAPHRVGDYTDTIVTPHALRAATDLAATGRADLNVAYFRRVAAAVSAEMLGFGSAAELGRWSDALLNFGANFAKDPATDEAGRRTLGELDSALPPFVAGLRERPGDSIVSHLIHAGRPAGSPRPDIDVTAQIKHFVFGAVLPAELAGATLLELLAHPQQFAEVAGNRYLLGAAVNESVRIHTTVSSISRRLLHPAVIAGRELGRGATLASSTASANRDATVFTDPDVFDIHRTVRTNVAFGAGPHRCPLFALVPAIARTMLDVLFDHLPSVRLVPGQEPILRGWKIRRISSLNATWQQR